jgi:hypothetical protein
VVADVDAIKKGAVLELVTAPVAVAEDVLLLIDVRETVDDT